jgi:nicotinamidase-related amidase
MGRVVRLERERCLLLVVDIQEQLAPHVAGHEALIARTAALLDAAEILGIPRLLTEHCAERIGPVLAPLRARFGENDIVAKTAFAAVRHPGFEARLRATGRTQVVVAGMEAHVCVLQSVLGLVASGFEVVAVADAIGSRGERGADRAWALDRMRDEGARLAGTETVLFEWTRTGDDASFRHILRLVKGLPA